MVCAQTLMSGKASTNPHVAMAIVLASMVLLISCADDSVDTAEKLGSAQHPETSPEEGAASGWCDIATDLRRMLDSRRTILRVGLGSYLAENDTFVIVMPLSVTEDQLRNSAGLLPSDARKLFMRAEGAFEYPVVARVRDGAELEICDLSMPIVVPAGVIVASVHDLLVLERDEVGEFYTMRCERPSSR